MKSYPWSSYATCDHLSYESDKNNMNSMQQIMELKMFISVFKYINGKLYYLLFSFVESLNHFPDKLSICRCITLHALHERCEMYQIELFNSTNQR